MISTLNDLSQHALATCYLVSSDDAFLVDEACEDIHEQAKLQGFQKEIIHLESATDLEKWVRNMRAGSLFFAKRLEIGYCPLQYITRAAVEILESYLAHPVLENILVLCTSKLNTAQQQKSWVSLFDKYGIIVRIAVPTGPAFLSWLRNRLTQKQLKLDTNALQRLADFTEGNLKAAAQAIEQLSLLYKDKMAVLDTTHIEAAIAHDARYDLYQFAESCLMPDSVRTLQILRTLKATGTEFALVLWVITKEIRLLNTLAFHFAQKKPLSSLFKAHHIWFKKQALYQRLLEQHPLAYWQTRLKTLAEMDELLKTNQENVWNALETWCITVLA